MRLVSTMSVITFPEIQITPLSSDNLAEASAFLFTIYHDYYQSQLPDEILEQRSPNFFLNQLENKIGIAWLARLDSQVIGLLTVSSNCIDDIWVKQKYQRRKIGTRLVATALKHFSQKGFSSAQVGLENFNKPARLFFESMGWQEIGSDYISLQPSKWIQALVYSKRLSAHQSNFSENKQESV